MQNKLAIDRFKSPIGAVFLVARGNTLCSVDFVDYEERMEKLLARRYGDCALKHEANPGGLTARLRAYFEGDLAAIEDIGVEFSGTPFQETVWRALRDIPAGRTETYGRIAARIGRPAASRAVGHANSQNPIAIVVPCHRVIGADASLTGYAGGMHRKRWLLEHEGSVTGLFQLTPPGATNNRA
ncbi:MAG: methylated-DNA--[protein]-cysteine S-methyltransferase [Bryobacteraceae bacterium]